MIISFDVGGTLVDDKKFIDDLWFKSIPKELAKVKNISFEEARELCVLEYKKHMENYGKDINWINPNYWIKKFGIKKKLSEILPRGGYRVYQDVKEVFGKLKNKTIIISSSHPIEVIRVELGGYTKHINKIFSSQSIGIRKNEKRFWFKILKELGIPPNGITHIGDDYVRDYLIPKTIGIKSILLNRKYTNLIEITEYFLNEID